ncbi:ATP-binding protein [Brevibacillus centrosporus]|uniref:ATP-binding protein n=1 Tax=Brevibacillus centrosporus TaxID=54910 RepID=UPI00382559B9
MIRVKESTALKYFLIVLLFVSVLQLLRWSWSDHFYTADSPQPIDGVLDLRGVDLDKSAPFFLDGEWHFYPNQFLSQEDIASKQKEARLIPVPGDWGSLLNGSSYGYGTYHLRVLIEPLKQPVSFWLQGIQAASEIEINGIPSSKLGKIADNAQDYVPENESYTATYSTDGATEIDLLIRAANYDEPFKGGLTRSIRFGSLASIDYVRWYSIGFQLVTLIILLLHGLYTVILYLFNPKEKTLFITGLLMLLVGVAIVIGHDNLLLLWLPISYSWAIKLRLIVLLWQNYLILLIYRKFAMAPAKNAWLRVYFAAMLAFCVYLLAVPASWVNAAVDVQLFTLFYLLPFAWFLYITGTLIFRKQADQDIIFLLLTAAAILSNLSWSFVEAVKDVTTVYYPLDILAAITGFSTYWFKRYFRNSREVVKLNEQLQQANKQKDQFLANTSHELRTPLHGIMNIAQNVVAKEKETLNHASRKDMELLITISRRMSHMLGDLLDVARLQEHRIALQREPLQIQAVVPGVIGMLSYMTAGKPIQLKMDIADTLPPVMADEKRLVQILYNLLHNALKYTEQGTISVSVETSDKHAVIRVADTGVGMDEETMSRIFLPYEQGTHGISDGRGIGLGLSICRQLVELHGGTLTVESKPQEGSVFSFQLPFADPSNHSSSQASEPLYKKQLQDEASADAFYLSDETLSQIAAASLLNPPLQSDESIRILAVDDDPVNLNVLVGILSAEPYTITTVSSAKEALELLGTQPWDLLIADVMMPHMSGYELTQRVREQYSVSELPILLLTARSQPADIYTGFLSGANDYVTKPVDALELRYRIRALTTLKQSIQERLRMEAAYLQAQIHPHFLFNTLNSIMALSEIDTEKMRMLGDAFASYLRISFHFLNTGELVDLSHELELVQAYLFIEKERFEERLSIVWEVDPGISVLLPPLSIQPLVENAVKHGLLSRNRGGTVTIRITQQDRFTLIEVEDDGKGMDQATVLQLLNTTVKGISGIGVANTHRRLTQLYGQGLSIASRPDEGTIVSFLVPIRDEQ